MTESNNSNVNPYAPVSTVDAATERRLTLATPIPISGRWDIDDALLAIGISPREGLRKHIVYALAVVVAVPLCFSRIATAPQAGGMPWLIAGCICVPAWLRFIQWAAPSVRKSRQQVIDTIDTRTGVEGLVTNDELIVHSDNEYARIRWANFSAFVCSDPARIQLAYANQAGSNLTLPARFFPTHEQYQNAREFLDSHNPSPTPAPPEPAPELFESSNVSSDQFATATFDHAEAVMWDAENWPFEKTGTLENANVSLGGRSPTWISYLRVAKDVNIGLLFAFAPAVLAVLSWIISDRLRTGNFSFLVDIDDPLPLLVGFALALVHISATYTSLKRASVVLETDLKLRFANEGIYMSYTTYDSWWKWEKISRVEVKSRTITLFLQPADFEYQITAEAFDTDEAFRTFARRLEEVWQASRSAQR